MVGEQGLMQSLACIYRNDDPDQVAGSGFLIDDRHLVTCAHVVNEAVGRSEDSRPLPDVDLLKIEFPVEDHHQVGRSFSATVIHWHRMRKRNRSRQIEDVAVLELSEGVGLFEPDRFTAGSPRLEFLTCRVGGFGWEIGEWNKAQVLGVVGGCWHQLDMAKRVLRKGSSGGPVLAEVEGREVVVGMAVARRPGDTSGYMLPFDRLRHLQPNDLESEGSDWEDLLLRVIDREEQSEQVFGRIDQIMGEGGPKTGLFAFAFEGRMEDMPGYFGEKLLIQEDLDGASDQLPPRPSESYAAVTCGRHQTAISQLVDKIQSLCVADDTSPRRLAAVFTVKHRQEIAALMDQLRKRCAPIHHHLTIYVLFAILTDRLLNFQNVAVVAKVRQSRLRRYLEGHDVDVLPPLTKIGKTHLLSWVNDWPLVIKKNYDEDTVIGGLSKLVPDDRQSKPYSDHLADLKQVLNDGRRLPMPHR